MDPRQTSVIAALIPAIITGLLVAFWIWMAMDFARNERIPPNERVFWLLGFVFFGVLTAGYYYFKYYRAE